MADRLHRSAGDFKAAGGQVAAGGSDSSALEEVSVVYVIDR